MKLERFSIECHRANHKVIQYCGLSKRTQIIQSINQNLRVISKADAKRGKPCASQSWLILALILIGWDSYSSFSQSHSLAMLKQSEFELLPNPSENYFKKNLKKTCESWSFALLSWGVNSLLRVSSLNGLMFLPYWLQQWPYFGGRQGSCNKPQWKWQLTCSFTFIGALAFRSVSFAHLHFNKHPFAYITFKLRRWVVTHSGSCLVAFTAGCTAGAPCCPSTPVAI